MKRRTQSHLKQAPQHYAVQFDTDEYARPITMDARSLTLPSVAIIAVVMVSASFTYFLTQERSRLDARIDMVVTSVENLATSISQLADGLRLNSSDKYTKVDHDLFCARMAIANPGLVCPIAPTDAETQKDQMHGTLKSVQDQAKAARERAAKAKRRDIDN